MIYKQKAFFGKGLLHYHQPDLRIKYFHESSFPLLDDIRQWKRDGNLFISHVFHEANQAADYLANYTLNGDINDMHHLASNQ